MVGGETDWLIDGDYSFHGTSQFRFVYATFTLMEMQGKIMLAVGAHPDDLEFFAGGTIARFIEEGGVVYALILTDGSKGSEDHQISQEELMLIRQEEQKKAAAVLGVKEVFFFSYVDGELENSLDVRRNIVELVRKVKPDVVLTFDPSYLYDVSWGMVNHPDHRAAGQATIDAVFPFSRNRRTFPELFEQGKDVHHVSTLLLINLKQHNHAVDISAFFTKKIEALAQHVSQKDNSDEVRDLVVRLCKKSGGVGTQHVECFVKLELAS